MESHTPGPWIVKKQSGNPYSGCDVISTSALNGYICTTSGNALANARLIAASPRMKEALFKTMEYLELRADGESNELWAEVAAVLSKATGENVE